MFDWIKSPFALTFCCLLSFGFVTFDVKAQESEINPGTSKFAAAAAHGGGGAAAHGGGGAAAAAHPGGAGARGAGTESGGAPGGRAAPGGRGGPAGAGAPEHPQPNGLAKGAIIVAAVIGGGVIGMMAAKPRVITGEPDDHQLGQEFKYGGTYFIHNLNPCEWYNEGSKSHKNKARSKGCDHECRRLKKAVRKLPSSNCPYPDHCKCWQVSGMAGRCYTIGNSNDTQQNWRYELVDGCKPV